MNLTSSLPWQWTSTEDTSNYFNNDYIGRRPMEYEICDNNYTIQLRLT